MAVKTTRFDSAEHLDSDEAISAYMEDALERTIRRSSPKRSARLRGRAACRRSPSRRDCPAKASTRP